MELIKGHKCHGKTISKDKIRNTEFYGCSFNNLIISDVLIENVLSIDCQFKRVIIEASRLEQVTIRNSSINSLSIRGNREITKGILKPNKVGSLKDVSIESGNKIMDITFKGNLEIENCDFQEAENRRVIKKPFIVYKRCHDIINTDWEGDRKKIGLKELETFYLSKDIEHQEIDFIVYSVNEYLTKEQNNCIKDVFKLIIEQS